MNNLKYLIIGVVIFAAGFLLGQSFQTPTKFEVANDNQEEVQIDKVFVSFEFEEDSLSFYPTLWTPGATVHSITKVAAETNNLEFEVKDYGELGELITKIGDKENGQNQSYWQYWVNNEQPQVAAASYTVQPGDVVEWKFTRSEY